MKSTHQVAPGYQGTLGGEDVVGLSAGMNFNKYVGAEISVDRYEFILDSPKGEKAAEYSVSPFLGLIRLRYPMFDGRLVPYALGGAGVGFVQVDDKFPVIGATSLKKNDFSPVGAVGGGVEYFIANNLALGLEAKYLFHQAALGVNGQDNRTNLNGLLWGGSLRLYFSEDSGGAPPLPSQAADRPRFYLAVVASESTRIRPIVPQVRVMYPLAEDRLVPYAVGGVGVGIAEFGDQTPEASAATTGHAQSLSVVGTAGVGLDYLVVNNVAINVETKYRIFPSAMLEINGVPYTINLSGVLVSAGVRIFFN